MMLQYVGEEHVNLSSTWVMYPFSVAIRVYFRAKPGSEINIFEKNSSKMLTKKKKERARKKEAGGDEKLIIFFWPKKDYSSFVRVCLNL